MKRLLFFSLFVCLLAVESLAQNCPKIVRDGATLRVAEPLGGVYQWFKDGTPIAGETGDSYTPAVDGNYSVEVYGTSASYNYAPPANAVNVTVSGQTLDRLLQPVAGVTVTFDGQTTTSDAQGRFSFPAKLVGKGRITLKYEKAGYFASGQGLLAHQNGAMKTVVALVSRGTPIPFVADSGFTAKSRFAKIEIAKQALKLPSGQTYSGLVNAYVASLSPESPIFDSSLPGGDHLGKNAPNQDALLRSFGITAVEFESANGQKLQLDPAKPATLTFTPSIQDTSFLANQTQIPLWHYDEVAQLWREEGAVTRLANGNYQGTVTHFSWWGWNWVTDFAYINGCVQNSCGLPVAYTRVSVQNWGSFYTDSLGCFVYWAPPNSLIDVTAGLNTVAVTTLAANDTVTVTGVLAQSEAVLYAYSRFIYPDSVYQITVANSALNSPIASLYSYSLDGQNFQPSPVFANLDSLTDSVWVKAGSCVQALSVYQFTNPYACQMLSQVDLLAQPLYEDLNAAIAAQNAGQNVYRFKSFNDLDLNYNSIQGTLIMNNPDLCPCLQELMTTRDSMLKSIGNLVHLQRLTYRIVNGIAYATDRYLALLTDLKYLNIDGSGTYTTLTDQVGQLSSLDTLKISGDPLGLNDNFTQLSNLRYLEIVNIGSSLGLPSNFDNFNNLINLETFKMTGSGFIPFSAPLPKLKTIEIYWTNSATVNPITSNIGFLTGLKKLSLKNDDINWAPSGSALPPELFTLTNLEELTMVNLSNVFNTLNDSIPPAIANLTNLRILALDECGVSYISPEIGQLSNLEKLSIFSFFKPLDSIPAEIGNLTGLKQLDLGGTFETLPQSIYNLPNLKRLAVRSDSLIGIPPEIGNLTNLGILILPFNKLTALPNEVWNLPSLEALDISNNQFSSLPPAIGNLNSLKCLSLENNNLSQLPATICDLKDTIGSGPYASFFSGFSGVYVFPPITFPVLNNFQIFNNPGTTAMQAQWNACP